MYCHGQAVTPTNFCRVTAIVSEITVTVDNQTAKPENETRNKIMNINIKDAGMW